MVRSLTPGMALWLTVSADNQIELDQENRKSSAEFYQCFEPAALATGLITKEQQEIRQNGIESKAKILHVVPMQLTLVDGSQYETHSTKKVPRVILRLIRPDHRFTVNYRAEDPDQLIIQIPRSPFIV